ncbi:MAG: M24 family metallopeptidase [Phycisphaerales bacterium]|nr:M24 family metallopeptidase [Phycisphaerales bacterium]
MTRRPAPKTDAEIRAIEQAAVSVEHCVRRLLASARPGVCPRDILALVPFAPGSPLAADDRTASVAVNNALPLEEVGSTPLEAGDLVTIDFAARIGGVWADLSDAVVITEAREDLAAGTDPALGFLRDARRATAGLASAIVPGRLWSDVVAEWRSGLGRSGLTVVPGFAGHGVGAGLHESPVAPYGDASGGPVAPDSDFTIRPGLVFTVEPVLRSPCGRWATWIERVVVVERCGARALGGGWDDLGPRGA